MNKSRSQGARRIGFVGLGDMGGPIARRIAAAGFPLTVWARRASAFSELGSELYDVAASLADLGRECDLVGLCVFGDDDVRRVQQAWWPAALDAAGVGVTHSQHRVCRAVYRVGVHRERTRRACR